jgi:hypothetical protein
VYPSFLVVYSEADTAADESTSHDSNDVATTCSRAF